jgi:hypothetical protein
MAAPASGQIPPSGLDILDSLAPIEPPHVVARLLVVFGYLAPVEVGD